MSKTNIQVVQEFIEEVSNHKHFDQFFDYCSADCVSNMPPYVGLGIGTDDSSGEHVYIRQIAPNSPAAEHLHVGDEIVRISDDQKVWETFHELKSALWGQGILGTPVTVTVRREEKLLTARMNRSRIESFRMKLADSLEMWKNESLKNWPDAHTEIRLILSENDLVATLEITSGTNMEYHRSAIWAECSIYRLENGKIVEIWGAADNFAQMKQLGYEINEPVREPAL